jgi:hypothetical protein
VPQKQKKENKKNCQASVAHTCNPSYSGGRDLEALNLKPARTKEFMRPCIEKYLSQKKGW